MDLNDKIKQILVDKSISPSHFADEIGVQRSSISHILAGRNKPSLDIVQKIVRRYPDLGLDWIWEDDEFPPVSTDSTRYESRDYASKTGTNGRVGSPLDLREKNKPESIPVQRNLEAPDSSSFAEKSIERILIFYSDGTFKQYTPE
jgi:transcriptional regulator with XRE-family HTH domain